MIVTREQALRFRVRRHHLAERATGAGAASAAARVGLQDTPPGTAAVALAARADVAPAALDEELVIVPSIRGAPLALAPADLAVFTAGLDPPDEAAARVVIGNACKTLDVGALEALDRVSDAVREALADGPLARDDFHEALRERLPRDLLWWCRGCDSHHVHPSLWRATGIRGVLAIVGREGRSAVFGAPPAHAAVEDPGGELARRFLSAYGPARPRLLAGWAGIATAHAERLWDRAGPLTEVDLEGAPPAWVLAADTEVLAGDAAEEGVRLLPNLDPLHAGRDREVLVPDEARRKRIWRVLGGPGTVLADGALAGTWRPAKKGRRLVVTVEPFGRLSRAALDALAEEAERLAPFRGAQTGEVVVTSA